MNDEKTEKPTLSVQETANDRGHYDRKREQNALYLRHDLQVKERAVDGVWL